MNQYTTTRTRTRTRERTHAPACTADQCRQGRTACPCPQACELPAHEAPATPTEITGFWLVVLTAVVSVLFLVFLAGGA